jgi:hypothetical protein
MQSTVSCRSLPVVYVYNGARECGFGSVPPCSRTRSIKCTPTNNELHKVQSMDAGSTMYQSRLIVLSYQLDRIVAKDPSLFFFLHDDSPSIPLWRLFGAGSCYELWYSAASLLYVGQPSFHHLEYAQQASNH